MRINAFRARPRRRDKPKDDGEGSIIADNILDRDFRAERPNQKWLADFTYIWTSEGWLYVAVVLDLFSRRAVGWSRKADRDASLVRDAEAAIVRRIFRDYVAGKSARSMAVELNGSIPPLPQGAVAAPGAFPPSAATGSGGRGS